MNSLSSLIFIYINEFMIYLINRQNNGGKMGQPRDESRGAYYVVIKYYLD